MKTPSKLRKKSFTIVEQACHEIHGFGKLYQELDDKTDLCPCCGKGRMVEIDRRLAGRSPPGQYLIRNSITSKQTKTTN